MEEVYAYCYSPQECSTIKNHSKGKALQSHKRMKGNFIGNVHKSTIGRTMTNSGAYGRIARRNPLLSKTNIASHLQFAEKQVDKPGSYQSDVLQTDEAKLEGLCLQKVKHFLPAWEPQNKTKYFFS